MKKLGLSLICSVLILAIGGLAQQAPASKDVPAKEDVQQLLKLTQVRERMVQLMEGMKGGMEAGALAGFKQKVPNPTPEQIKRLNLMSDSVFEELPIDEMVDAMIPVYQRHLTKSDLDAIVAFYASPAGQHLLKEQPAMMSEAMQAGQDIMLKRVPELTRKLDERIAKLAEEEAQKKAPDQK